MNLTSPVNVALMRKQFLAPRHDYRVSKEATEYLEDVYGPFFGSIADILDRLEYLEGREDSDKT